MGDLSWRAKGTRLGCRRGWVRVLGLAALVLVGYFAIYGWLRMSGEIKFAVQPATLDWSDERVNLVCILGRPRLAPNNIAIYYVEKEGFCDNIPMRVQAMWPAVEMEYALHRRGWLRWARAWDGL